MLLHLQRQERLQPPIAAPQLHILRTSAVDSRQTELHEADVGNEGETMLDVKPRYAADNTV